jgi:hypothetical protein
MRKLLAIAAFALLAFSPALAQAQSTQDSQQSCDDTDNSGTNQNNQNSDLCSPVLWIAGSLALVGVTVGIVAATANNQNQPVSP